MKEGKVDLGEIALSVVSAQDVAWGLSENGENECQRPFMATLGEVEHFISKVEICANSIRKRPYERFFEFRRQRMNSKMRIFVLPLGKILLDALDERAFLRIRERHSVFDWAPYICLFERCSKYIRCLGISVLGCPRNILVDERVCKRLWRVFCLLKGRLASADLRQKQKNFKRSALKNYASAISFFNGISRRRSRILVLRVDFYGRRDGGAKEEGRSYERSVIEELKQQQAVLNQWLRERFGKGLLGYIWCLEWAPARGLHLHYTIILDGALHRQSVSLSMEVGEYWKVQITAGAGDYFNVNAKAPKYPSSCLGMVNCSEQEVIDGFERIAIYFTLGRVYKKERFGRGVDIFGRTDCLQVKAGSGRPANHSGIRIVSGFKRAQRITRWLV